MRVFPANRDEWLGLVLFPFKAYLPIGVILVFFFGTGAVRSGFATAAGVVMLGYVLCSFVFALAAVIRFFTHKRELVAETLLWAGVAFLIGAIVMKWGTSY